MQAKNRNKNSFKFENFKNFHGIANDKEIIKAIEGQVFFSVLNGGQHPNYKSNIHDFNIHILILARHDSYEFAERSLTT